VHLLVDDSVVLHRPGRRSELRATEIVDVRAAITTPAVDPAVGAAWLAASGIDEWIPGHRLALTRRVHAWAEFDDSTRVRAASIW